MSKIGRQPIPLPSGVKIELQGNRVQLKGSRGELEYTVPREITVAVEKERIVVSRSSDAPRHRALHGLVRSLLANMVIGVSQGFEKALEIVGVGYRTQKVGEKLVFQIGHSLPEEVTPPPGISFLVESPTKFKVAGIDKAQVGQVAAQIRELRPPDKYKGKGIRYAGESIRLKPGKAGKGVKK